MIKIYHVHPTRSFRVIWLLEEMGEPYELPETPYPPNDAFRAFSPTGLLPTIEDGDIVMGESIAILQYITGRKLQRALELGLTVGPNPDPAKYAEHLQFLHLGEASLGTMLSLYLRTKRLGPPDQQDNFTALTCRDNYLARQKVVERRLSDGRPYITGDTFTIADISLGYPFYLAETRGGADLLTDPIRAYLNRLRARPAFQRAEEKQ